MRDWEEFLTQVKRTRKPYLDLLSGGDRAKVRAVCACMCVHLNVLSFFQKKELRSLLRKGIPYQHRMQVWTRLVNHMTVT